MRALKITRFGGPEVLQVVEVPDPAPADGQALVRVRAAGVNRADLLQRAGHYPAPADAPPDIPGLEFAGDVVESRSDRVRQGQRVFGLCAGGAQAELLAVDAGLLVATPDSLDDVHAAALPEAFVTADDALFSQARLKRGETVLVHAVGSVIGIACVQLASIEHCLTLGTSRSPWKLERLKEFGLAHAIVADSNWPNRVREAVGDRGVDVIVDLVGGPYLKDNVELLALGGRLIQVGTLAGATGQVSLGTLMRRRAQVIGTVLRSRSLSEKRAAVGAFVKRWHAAILSDQLRMPVSTSFELAQASDAHRLVESDAALGKVVLTVGAP